MYAVYRSVVVFDKMFGQMIDQAVALISDSSASKASEGRVDGTASWIRLVKKFEEGVLFD